MICTFNWNFGLSEVFLYISSCLCYFWQGAFTGQHYDQDLSFHATEEDPVTKKVS